MLISTVLLAFSAVACMLLGLAVYAHNHRKSTHQAFVLLSANLALWAVGVLLVVHSGTEADVLLWLRMTFIVSAFLPYSFALFIGLFPSGYFDGPRWFLRCLPVAALALGVGSFTPWYCRGIVLRPGAPPEVQYGPVFLAYFALAAATTLFMLCNLLRKYRFSSGVQRRRIQHVLLGIFSTVFLAIATNLVAPAIAFGHLEAYGPSFSVLMVAIFAYAMVRYHLLDIRVIFKRTTVYAVLIASVTAVFLGTVSMTHYLFSAQGRTPEFIASALAGLLIALFIQPVKEQVQLLLDRLILKRRYDTSDLLARMDGYITQLVRLDQLVETVVNDLASSVGIESVRVYLVDENHPGVFIRECASEGAGEDPGDAACRCAELVEYVEKCREPLVLEKLLHRPATQREARIAMQMAELEARVCLPLRTKTGLIGFLTLGEKTSRDMYCNEDLIVLSTLAGRLGAAIENARLYRRLEHVNQHLIKILSKMREGVIAVNANAQIVEVNQSAINLLGTIALGDSIEVLAPEVAEVLNVTLRNQRPIPTFETRLKTFSGEAIPVSLSSSCMTSPEHGASGAMAMIYDLTEIKRLEANVQRADRLSSIGTLAAGMAHEIKNPLVSIKTFSQLLPTRYEDADFRRTFTDVVPQEVERINSIVSRLLDFARPRPVTFGRQNLRTTIVHVLTLVENQAHKARVELVSHIPDTSLDVYGDEQQLQQVFLNLVLNAIESLKDHGGGAITIEARLGRGRLGSNSGMAEIDCVEVSVADTGPGIPNKDLPHVFTPFYSTKDTGSGLGLSVVHGIVTEHGGDVDVTSVPGHGVTFVVRLPLENTQAEVVSL